MRELPQVRGIALGSASSYRKDEDIPNNLVIGRCWQKDLKEVSATLVLSLRKTTQLSDVHQ